MEKRAFAIHHNILRDIIERQSGTLDKAVLEMVMNLIEAGASRGDIELTEKQLTVRDDGKGFETREEVLAAFEVFGKSDERKAEEKRFAKFQIGRGQAFPFGKTTYRTRTFEMSVDLRSWTDQIDYVLRENLPDVPGCTVTVEFYEKLDKVDVVTIGREITRNCEYVDVPLFLNGKQINVDPATAKWSLETDDAYYRFNAAANRVRIYNLGVFTEGRYVNGMGGVVVSKKQLVLNFARNQVIESCPVWRRISKVLKETSKPELLDKKSFSADEAATLVSGLETGEHSAMQLRELRIFKDANGKRLDVLALLRWPCIAFDLAGSVQADKVMQLRTGVVLDINYTRKMLDLREGSDPTREFKALLRRLNATPPPIVSAQSLYADLDDTTKVFKDNQLSKDERAALETLRAFFSSTSSRGRYYCREVASLRTISVGTAEGMLAWTDGNTYIVIDRAYLRKNMRTASGWAKLILLLAHEYAHGGGERTHDGDFYERYHDLTDPFMENLGVVYHEYANRMIKLEGRGLKRIGADLQRIETIEGADADAQAEAPLASVA